jgi:hypothetical protein
VSRSLLINFANMINNHSDFHSPMLVLRGSTGRLASHERCVVVTPRACDGAQDFLDQSRPEPGTGLLYCPDPQGETEICPGRSSRIAACSAASVFPSGGCCFWRLSADRARWLGWSVFPNGTGSHRRTDPSSAAEEHLHPKTSPLACISAKVGAAASLSASSGWLPSS